MALQAQRRTKGPQPASRSIAPDTRLSPLGSQGQIFPQASGLAMLGSAEELTKGVTGQKNSTAEHAPSKDTSKISAFLTTAAATRSVSATIVSH